KNITTALIIGFITGSLGVVWPWKETIFKTDDSGAFLFDSDGEKVIRNYQRYMPDFSNSETWTAFGFIILGIIIVLALDWYGQRSSKYAYCAPCEKYILLILPDVFYQNI